MRLLLLIVAAAGAAANERRIYGRTVEEHKELVEQSRERRRASGESHADEPVDMHTLALLKPEIVANATARSLLLQDLSVHGFQVGERRVVDMTRDLAEAFYAEHRERPFFDALVEYMTSGPVEAMILHREDAVRQWRDLMGPTDPEDARDSAPRSIRARFAASKQRNAVHGSDSLESFRREAKLLFPHWGVVTPARKHHRVSFERGLVGRKLALS